MTVEIITIGDEILIGQVVDSNSAWMAQQLNLIGANIQQITSISDTHDDIVNTLDAAIQRVDLVLMTGGLGPTKDDITKKTLAEYFNSDMTFNQEAYENVERHFRQRGYEMTALNKKQAEIPAKCTPIQNPNGTAPGMWFEKKDKIVVSMPGVPYEMKPMVSDFIIPRITKKINGKTIIHKTVLTHGLGESFLSQKIAAWEDSLPENIKLAYLPQPGIVRLRLTAIGKDKAKLKSRLNNVIKKLHEYIPDLIFGYDNDSMEAVVGELLRSKKQTLSTAESCTGGYIASMITGIPGSSDYYKGSVIAYSNEVKEQELGVPHKTLVEHGAVSKPVVKEMALGIRQKLNTGYSIAISGIAGPTGGTDEKPVGTTWIAVATPDNLIAKRFQFGEHRQRNIRKSALMALDILRKELLKM
ncbi:MAG: competence/damage-inducible protein A [Bacteroidales bacterium]|nr:competence/damage-inducible protein A [Bacteroidales bacterium]